MHMTLNGQPPWCEIASWLQESICQCLDCRLSVSAEQSRCLQRDTAQTMQVFGETNASEGISVFVLNEILVRLSV